jgi:hypothetical protein
LFFEIDVLIPILIHFYHHKLLQSLIDALNHLVMTNLLTNLLFLIVGLGYGVTFVLMKERAEKFWLVCRSATTALLFMNGSWLLLIFTGVIVYEEVFEQSFSCLRG